MPDEALTQELKQHLAKISHGAAIVGVGSVDRFVGAPAGHRPQDFVPDAQAVVVIALPIVAGLMQWDTFMEKSELVKEVDTYVHPDGREETWSPRTQMRKHVERRCSYEVINMELQTLSMHGCILLERAGHLSVYMPTTYGMTLSWPGNYRWDFPKPPKGMGPFSHKHAAVAAGVGRFGLNNLLLTPQYGPRQRLVSLITAAPLAPDPLIEEPICLGEDCSLCVEQCPADSFGDPWELDVAGQKMMLAKIDIEACRGYYKDSSHGSQCGRECMTFCPVGQLTPPKPNETPGSST